MTPDELQKRTKGMACEVIRFVEKLPQSMTSQIMGKQLVRSATSVAANYRAACRAKSKADFVYKLGIVEEETDESLFWLEMFVETGKAGHVEVQTLKSEVEQLLKIFVASRITAKSNKVPSKK